MSAKWTLAVVIGIAAGAVLAVVVARSLWVWRVKHAMYPEGFDPSRAIQPEAASGVEVATLRGHEDAVTSVAFSPDGTWLASGSGDRTIKLWDVATGGEVATLRGHDRISSVAFSPDGTRLASGSLDGTITLWDPVSGQAVATLHGHEAAVDSVTFSPVGTHLASGSGDTTIRLWDVEMGEEIAVLRGHDKGVWSVAYSPDGARLASGSTDATIKLWDAVSGEEVATLLGNERTVRSVAFSADGTRLASGSDDRMASGRERWRRSSPPRPLIKLWDVASGEEIATLRGHTNSVYSVAFSPDGTHLASGSGDGTIRLWDVASGEEVATLRAHETGPQGGRSIYSVAFSPDGTRLASGSERGTIRLWDATLRRGFGVGSSLLTGGSPVTACVHLAPRSRASIAKRVPTGELSRSPRNSRRLVVNKEGAGGGRRGVLFQNSVDAKLVGVSRVGASAVDAM